METPFLSGNLQAVILFLTDRNGIKRPSLTGRLTDEGGHVVAVGAIHEYIVPAFADEYPFVCDFAVAHGCDSEGVDMRGNREGGAERALAWERARSAFESIAQSPPSHF